MSAANSQALLSALSHAVQLVGSRIEAERGRSKLLAYQAQLAHEERMAETSAGVERERIALFRHCIDVLVQKRVDVLQGAFTSVLAGYADQARHFMEQQDRVADAHASALDPILRASHHARLQEIDAQLSTVRQDAHRLFREMAKALTLLGGRMPPLAGGLQRDLGLGT